MALKIIILLGLVALAQGYTKFSTTCTTPTTAVSFVSSPDSRGTLDILWSSLFTIFACTWTIQHLNIPEQRYDPEKRTKRDPGRRGDIIWGLKSLWSSTKWMLVTVIAPEVLLAKALGELIAAKETLRELQKYADEDGVQWTWTHSLFANMGGFAICWNVGKGALSGGHESSTQREHAFGPHLTTDVSDLQQDDSNSPALANEPSLVQQDEVRAEIPFLAARSGNWIERERVEDLTQMPVEDQNSFLLAPLTPHSTTIRGDRAAEASYTNPFHLLASDILRFRKDGHLAKLPSLTEDEINDKSKSDSFARAIAAGQIAWTAVQIIARVARNLTISQLEIAVIAFSACAIIIYGLNWKKPKGIKVAYTLLNYAETIPDHVYRALPKRVKSEVWGVLAWAKGRDHGAPISNTMANSKGSDELYGILLGCTIFGGIHLAAWNFGFPSRSEQIIWRATSSWCTLYALCVLFLMPLFANFAWLGYREMIVDGGGDTIPAICLVTLTVLYVLARLFLIVEIFRTLFFPPPGRIYSDMGDEHSSYSITVLHPL